MDKEKRASEKRTVRNQKEDVVLNRTLIWFGAAVVLEFLLLLLNRYYITPKASEIAFQGALLAAFPTIIGVSAVGFVASLVWLVLKHRAGKTHLLPGVLTGVFASVLVISVTTFRFFATGVQFLCWLVPAVAVLGLVYYLYQREFFTITVLSGLGILGLWIFRRSNGGHLSTIYGYAAAVAVVLVLTILLCRSAQRSQGMLTRGTKKFRLFHKNANYGMIYLTSGIVAAALAVGLLMGMAAAYYLIFVLVAWLFVMAVYYTVRLM